MQQCRRNASFFTQENEILGKSDADNYISLQKVVRDDTVESNFNPRTRHPRRSHPRSLTGLFSSGIGGAGNMHSRREGASLTQEEESARARIRQSHFAKRWFVGIGGAGNFRGNQHRHSPGSDFTNTTSSSGYSTTSIGVAEVLRRKLLGERSR